MTSKAVVQSTKRQALVKKFSVAVITMLAVLTGLTIHSQEQADAAGWQHVVQCTNTGWCDIYFNKFTTKRYVEAITLAVTRNPWVAYAAHTVAEGATEK